MADYVELSSDDEEVAFVPNNESVKPVHFQKNVNVVYANRTRNQNVIAPWKPCFMLGDETYIDVDDAEQTSYHLVSCENHQKMNLPNWKVAIGRTSRQDYKNGTRVIVFRKAVDLPYEINYACQEIRLYASNDNEPYAGIIADKSKNDKYMIFFDDGHVQSVDRKDIRLVFGNDGLQHVHWNAKKYFEWFVSIKNRFEILPTLGQVNLIELNGEWVNGSIVTLDPNLPLAQFSLMRDNQPDRFEWLYLGSPRILEVWRNIIREKQLDGMLKFDGLKVNPIDEDCILFENVPSTDRVTYARDEEAPISIGNDFVNHECSHECVKIEDSTDIEKFSLFHRPLSVGFKRDQTKYKAPCGLPLKKYGSIRDYLMKTDSKLRLDSFALHRQFDPSQNQRLPQTAIYDKDISAGKENLPIPVVGKPLLLDKNFNYVTKNNFDSMKDLKFEKTLARDGCDCIDDCWIKKDCSCWRLTVKKMLERTPTKNDLEAHRNIGYTNFRLEGFIESGIVECGENCKCNAGKCSNRVVQRALQLKLQVFETPNKCGYGVRTTADIPSGVFITSYFGEIIDEFKAIGRDYCYYFTLGKQSISLDHHGSPSDAKKQRLDLEIVQNFLNFFPKQNNTWIGDSDIVPEDISYGIEFIIDSNFYGNVTRFFNHSCNPNMFVQKVFVDDDERFPTISFFTNKLIKAGTELTFDYKYELNDAHKTACKCEENNCRGRLV